MFIFIIIAVLYIWVILFYAEKIAPEGYSKKVNTINELACQTYENRSVMQRGFKGFGTILILGIIIYRDRMFSELHYSIPLFLYAFGMVLSGFFGSKPFEPLVFYSVKEGQLSSFIAQFTGFWLGILVVMKAIIAIGTFNRVLNILMIVFILYMSIMSSRKGESRGLYHRGLFLGSFIWLMYAYSGMMG